VKTVDEHIELIRRGAHQIETASELRKKLERSVATGILFHCGSFVYSKILDTRRC
jgi:hypothetical protein